MLERPSWKGSGASWLAPPLFEASRPCCSPTHVQGPGALQHVASLSKVTSRRVAREGAQINLSGWPAALRKPPSLWKMRALFRELPSGGWNLLWTGSPPQECCLRGSSGVCCGPAVGSKMCQGPRAPEGGGLAPSPLDASE